MAVGMSSDTGNDADKAAGGTDITDLVLGTDDVDVVDEVHRDYQHRHDRECNNVESPRGPAGETSPRRSSLRPSVVPRPSVTELVFTEAATFFDVFGFLGVPMIIVFLLSAGWTFTLAYIQVHPTEMANSIMNTTHFDNGEFWQLPRPAEAIVISSAFMLSLFGVGYTGLVVLMVFFYRAFNDKRPGSEEQNPVNGKSTDASVGEIAVRVEEAGVKRTTLDTFIAWMRHKFDIPKDIRDHYYTALLDLPKLIFQTTTLFTYLSLGFPTPIVYLYSILLLCNWFVACYRSQRYVVDPNLIIARLYYTYDLFFAVFAPLVVLVYFILKFQFNRAEFATKMETIQGGSFDTVARLFGDPSQISSFCNAFHYLQFSSGSSLFFKSALNLLSLYKWSKIIMTLIHNHHERRLERERKAQVQPLYDESKPRGRAQSVKAVLTKKLEAATLKPKLGKHFVAKVLLSLIFFVAGSAIFVYSIGSVQSSKAVCSKFDKCVVASHRWNYGSDHCPCLVFADRQTAPRTFAEWTDPVDISSNLAELAQAGELRIVQVINRAVPELPEELRNCHHLEQLILVYTKTLRLPEWMSELSELQYLHFEGDYTSKRLQVVPAGIFDHMPHLTFIHFGGIPDVKELPSFSSLKNLRYLALAILNSLEEMPSFEGLSKLDDLNIVEATRIKTLPSLTPLVSLKSLGIRYRTGVCCNGFITGTCDTTSFQCLPKAGEPYPMTCVSERVSDADKAILDQYDATAICPNWFPYDLEASAPTKFTSDDLCGSTLYKECYLNGVQGICYNTRMMVISCVTQQAYITMRQLQIERKVGDACDVAVEAWLGSSDEPLDLPQESRTTQRGIDARERQTARMAELESDDVADVVDKPGEVAPVSELVLQTDDITVVDPDHPDQRHRVGRKRDKLQSPKESTVESPPRRSSLRTSAEHRPSVVEIVFNEAATFHDVFGLLGVPMMIVFVLSAIWTFMLAYIQLHATEMANSVMNTTNFDNGEFWQLPRPDESIVISSAVMLALFGAGYTGLVGYMLFFYRRTPKREETGAGAGNSDSATNAAVDNGDSTTAESGKLEKSECYALFAAWMNSVPKDIRDHYLTAALDLPKLIFQTTTLFTYLTHGFPAPLVYSYSVLLLFNWFVACYRSQRYVVDPNLIIARLYYTFDLFFAVFAPLVVLVYFIRTFHFNRAEFATKMETIQGGSFDTVARLFGDPSQISSFCNAFHYLQFSSGSSLFFKSALNLLSLYKWSKIIMTLIHNHHERRLERERKAQVQPLYDESKPRGRAQSVKAVLTKKLEAATLKPKLGKHFVAKVLLSLIFFVAGSAIFVYSIGSVQSSKAVCSKFDKCVVASHRWNYGSDHCPCLVFADRQMAPGTFAEWTDPVDISSNLAELAQAGELRIVQVINRAVPELPEELRNCHHLEQLILVYTKTLRLPEWMSELSELQYLHFEGDYTSKRLQVVPAGIFDHMPHLTFIHFGGIPDVKELPSFSSLKNLRYLALAILNSLEEMPSFEGLSKLDDLNIVEATRIKTLPSLTPLVSLKSLGIRYRTGVCCNGFITGTCDTTSFQCLPKAGEPYPMTCVSERVSDADKAILDQYDATAICPNWFPYDLEASAPTKFTSDDLCGSTLYKECYLNGVQGICYNTRMMVISCVTQQAYITMRQLQIERKVGDACDVAVEAWLGCK